MPVPNQYGNMPIRSGNDSFAGTIGGDGGRNVGQRLPGYGGDRNVSPRLPNYGGGGGAIDTGGGQPQGGGGQPSGGQQGGGSQPYGGFNYYGLPYNNQPNPYMFSSQNGPQAGAVGRGPENYAPGAPISPALTQSYYQWLLNQANNLGSGYGATPYGQQSVFNPSTGTYQTGGLTAGMNPQLQGGLNYLNNASQYGMWAMPDINALRGEYGDLGGYLGQIIGQAGRQYNPGQMSGAWNEPLNYANMISQYGGYGFPGELLHQQSQWGARGNSMDPTGRYTGALSLQGLASGQGFQGMPGEYLNSATGTGGYGPLGDLMKYFGGTGQLGGQGNQTLNEMAASGMPIDQTEGWQRMVDAMERNQNQNLAQIAEHAAQSGNLAGSAAGGGSGYNQAVTDYMSQSNKDQSALLGQLQSQALEQARQRQMGASGQLQAGQLGMLGQLNQNQAQAGLYGAGSQLTASDFLQRLMAQGVGQMGQQQLQGLGQYGNMLANQQTVPFSMLSQLGNLAGQGANLVGQSQRTPYDIFAQMQGLQQGWTGQQLGAGQYLQGLDQGARNTNYNEFLRTQPEYSPMLQQLFQGASLFPPQYPTQYQNNPLFSLLGQLGGQAINNIGRNSFAPSGGGGGGGLGDIFGGFGGFSGFGINDPWGSSGGGGYNPNYFPNINSSWGAPPSGGGGSDPNKIYDPFDGFEY